MLAICRTLKKSYSPEKVLFIEYSSFNPLFMFTSTIFEQCAIRYIYLYVNSVSQVPIMMAQKPPKAEDRFYRGFFVSVKPILSTILNVKFRPFI